MDKPETIDQEIITDHYEMLYIIPANFTVEEVKPITQKVKKIIEENQGNITLEEDLGKLKLAYPIKNQSHGFYQLFEFDLPKQNLQNLNNLLKLTNDILRFLIVKKKLKTKEELAKEKKLQDKLAKKKEQAIEKIKEEKNTQPEKTKKTEKTTKEKISIEELDKKLDEILDTDDIM